MKKQIFFALLLYAVIVMALTSCSADDTTEPNTQTAAATIGAKATFNQATGGRAFANVIIDSFIINVEDFELEYDDDNDLWDDDFYTDIELEGPFELSFSEGQVVIPIVTTQVPQAQYEELEFEITKNVDVNSPHYEKSIQVNGTIDGTPFQFWHNFEEEVEVDFEDATTNITVSNTGETIVINFDLSFMFDTSVIDLSVATDGNADGFIEISPTDPDGNIALANTIKMLIKQNIELLDD